MKYVIKYSNPVNGQQISRMLEADYKAREAHDVLRPNCFRTSLHDADVVAVTNAAIKTMKDEMLKAGWKVYRN